MRCTGRRCEGGRHSHRWEQIMTRYGYGMGAGMWVVWILLLALIALVVYLVVRAGDQVHHQGDEGEQEDPHDPHALSLIHISEPTRRTPISYAVICLKKKNKITT